MGTASANCLQLLQWMMLVNPFKTELTAGLRGRQLVGGCLDKKDRLSTTMHEGVPGEGVPGGQGRQHNGKP